MSGHFLHQQFVEWGIDTWVFLLALLGLTASLFDSLFLCADESHVFVIFLSLSSPPPIFFLNLIICQFFLSVSLSGVIFCVSLSLSVFAFPLPLLVFYALFLVSLSLSMSVLPDGYCSFPDFFSLLYLQFPFLSLSHDCYFGCRLKSLCTYKFIPASRASGGLFSSYGNVCNINHLLGLSACYNGSDLISNSWKTGSVYESISHTVCFAMSCF